jgi:peptidoglycan/LPS O-acetylase OafA/YrhL
MTTPTRHAYFSFIDGLRAIAVVSVVIYHLNATWLPGGFAGVDIFFVISGFVVSSSVGSRERTSLPAFELYFLSRRLQRIAPALLVCLLVTAVASALIIPDAWLSQNNQTTGRYAFFGFSNLILAQNANAYFSPVTEFNMYTHTWSLGVEEQFYLLFPLLFWAWTRASKWRPFVLGIFVMLGALSLVYAWHERSVDALRAFYLLPSRFWELAAGAVLYQGMALAGRRFDVAIEQPRSAWKTGAAALGLCAMGYGLWAGTPGAFPAPGAILPVLGTVVVLGVLHGLPSSSPIVRLLTQRPMLFFGHISYSLYLWHWPVFVLFRWTYGLDSLLDMVVASAIALLLATISWRFVENPFRNAGWLRAAPRFVVVVGGIALLYAGYSAARLVDAHQQSLSFSTVTRHADDWYPTRDQAPTSSSGCATVPSIDTVGEGARITYQRVGCDKPVDGPTVYAIGDSHAIAFGSMLARYTLDTGAKVFLYNNGGCPFLSLQPWRESDAHCRASAKAAVDDMLGKIKPGDVLFLPSLRMPRTVDQWVRFPEEVIQNQVFGPDAVKGRDDEVRFGTEMLMKFHARGASIIVEAPNIVLHSPAFRCADPWTRTNPLCAGGSSVDREDFLKLRQPALLAVEQLTANVPGARMFDPVPVLCPNGPACSTYKDGRPLFFDGDHVSAYGNSLLLPLFTKMARDAVAAPEGAQTP